MSWAQPPPTKIRAPGGNNYSREKESRISALSDFTPRHVFLKFTAEVERGDELVPRETAVQEAGLGQVHRRLRVFAAGPVPFGYTSELFIWSVENVFPTQNYYVRVAFASLLTMVCFRVFGVHAKRLLRHGLLIRYSWGSVGLLRYNVQRFFNRPALIVC